MSLDDHLAYEIAQMCDDLDLLLEVWPAMHGATPSNLREGIAYFEAALVHMRNLIEFLVRGPPDHEDSLRPGDFGLSNYDYAAAQNRFSAAIPEGVEGTYGQICTYVSHLSKVRDRDVPSWDLQPLAATLVEEAKRFADAARDAGVELPEVRRALERCNY
jgi:hypothetical protein